jgi:glutaredoxin
MTKICPKCRGVRPADTSAPEWQCPFCGVAYAKAAGGPSTVSSRPLAGTAGATSAGGGISWGKLLMVLAIAYGAWTGFQNFKSRSAGELTSIAGRIGSNLSGEQLTALAASSQVSDVVFYTAPWCPYCAQAKSWMAQYGFKYEECDIQARSECASQLRGLGGDGVPYLVVKGRHMKDGFDSDEFVASLKNK